MKKNLRPRARRIQSITATQYEKKKVRQQLQEISRRDLTSLSAQETQILKENEHLLSKLAESRKRKNLRKARLEEVIDDQAIVVKQLKELTEVLLSSKHAIVYTGAGISTSAKIPDFRGSDGVWTRINSGKNVILDQNLTSADPTITHMCLRALYDKGIVKHIVSQNCDGLHLRSGIPQHALSEIHGNMYIEICKDCEKQFYRIFDVTEKTSLHRHKTERICEHCENCLKDTIVHFGERSNLRWPHNWEGAVGNAEKADVILCLGSSLKVMRSYKQLWMMSRPKHKRPTLFIVNLQWTPKDSQAALKIHSHVDFVMETIASNLGVKIPAYARESDPIFDLATPCDFNGPTVPIPHTFAQKFQLEERKASIKVFPPKSQPPTLGKVILNNSPNLLPQDTMHCTSKYVKTEFCDPEGSAPSSSMNGTCERNDLIKEDGSPLTNGDGANAIDGNDVRTGVPDGSSSHTSSEQGDCTKFIETSEPFFANCCAEAGNDPLVPKKFLEFESKPSVNESAARIPSWFGKGVKTKIKSSKKRKRRKKY